MEEKIRKAIEVLRTGGVIIFPTDTAIGIGVRIDNEKAVKRLFTIRKRPETQATPVLVSSVRMAQDYLLPINRKVKRLMNTYWPGGLTIVYPCTVEKVPKLVRGGANTLGVRMPKHAKLLRIIEEVGVPVLGPSANFHGEKTPFAFSEIERDLLKMVDYSLPLDAKGKKSSTVIDCAQDPWKITRNGAVNIAV